MKPECRRWIALHVFVVSQIAGLLWAEFVPEDGIRDDILQEVRDKVWGTNKNESIEVVGFPLLSVYNLSDFVDVMSCRTNKAFCNAGLMLKPTMNGLIHVVNPRVTKKLLKSSQTVRNTGFVDVEGSLTYEREFGTSVEISTAHSVGISHKLSSIMSVKFIIEAQVTTEFTASYNFESRKTTVKTLKETTSSMLKFSAPPGAETIATCSYDEVEFNGNFVYQMRPTGPVMIILMSNNEKDYAYLPMDNPRARAEFWLPDGANQTGSFKGSTGMNTVCDVVTRSLTMTGNETGTSSTYPGTSASPKLTTNHATQQSPPYVEFAIPWSDWSKPVKTGLHSGECSSIIMVRDLGAFEDARAVKHALKCMDDVGDDGWYDKDCGGVRFHMYLSSTSKSYKGYKPCLRDAIIRGFGYAYHAYYDDYGYRKHGLSEEKDYVKCLVKAKTHVSHWTETLLKDCLETEVNGWLEGGFNCTNNSSRGNFRSDGTAWNTPRDGWNFCKPCFTRALETGYSWAGCSVKWHSAWFDSSMDMNHRQWDLSEWPTRNF